MIPVLRCEFPDLPDVESRCALIERIRTKLKAAYQGGELPMKHRLENGVYTRALFIPKGICLVGKVHRLAHTFGILKGDISLLSERGAMRVQAPYWCIGKPGLKRVGYAHSDTWAFTIHHTNETELEKMEDLVYERVTQ